MDVTIPRLMLLVLAAGILLVLLGACAPAPVTVPVEVPVPVYCEPRDVPRPAMPTAGLRPEDGVYIVGRALWAELEVRDAYEARLLDALEQCKKKAPLPAP